MHVLTIIHILNVILHVYGFVRSAKSVDGPEGVFSTFGSSTSKTFSIKPKPKSTRVFGE